MFKHDKPLTVAGLISILEYIPGDLPIGVEDNHFTKYEFDAPRVSHTAINGPERAVINVLRPMQNARLREFTKSDWDGFAGAEEFADGTSPQIGETGNYVVIASGDGGEGATVDLMDADANRYYSLQVQAKTVAVEIATMLLNAPRLDDVILCALGFQGTEV